MDTKSDARPVKAGQYGIYWLVGAMVLLTLVVFFFVDMLDGSGVHEGVDCDVHAELVSLGEGTMAIGFRLEHPHAVASLGVVSLRVYESEDGLNWRVVQVLTAGEEPGLVGTDCRDHQGTVELTGQTGRYYRASLVFWAGDREESWSKTLWTGAVRG